MRYLIFAKSFIKNMFGCRQSPCPLVPTVLNHFSQRRLRKFPKRLSTFASQISTTMLLWLLSPLCDDPPFQTLKNQNDVTGPSEPGWGGRWGKVPFPPLPNFTPTLLHHMTYSISACFPSMNAQKFSDLSMALFHIFMVAHFHFAMTWHQQRNQKEWTKEITKIENKRKGIVL